MDTNDLSKKHWLLLPGTLCTSRVFDGLMGALHVPVSQRRHVCLDRPSVADFTSEFASISEDTIVCGFSLGAIVAAHHADRFKAHSLILFGLNPYPDDAAKAPSRYDLADQVRRKGGAATMQSLNPDVYGPALEQTRQTIYDMAEQSAVHIAAQTDLALSRPGALTALAGSQMPVLSLTGSKDQSAPPLQGKAVAEIAPQGHFKILDGLGHFAMLEDPQACAAALTHLVTMSHG